MAAVYTINIINQNNYITILIKLINYVMPSSGGTESLLHYY